MVTGAGSVIRNILLLRRAIFLKAAVEQDPASLMARSIVVDTRDGRTDGWNRFKVISQGGNFLSISVEAIDNAGTSIYAFDSRAWGKRFACYFFVGANVAALRLRVFLDTPGDAAMLATLRSISLIEFVWCSLFPKKSWRRSLPENRSRFLREPSAFLRCYLRPGDLLRVDFDFPRPPLSSQRMLLEREPEQPGRQEHPSQPTQEHPSQAIVLREGLCITGYLRSEIGLGQAARNLAHACDTQRLPLSFRNLLAPGRQNDREFATKCNQIRDRKANLLLLGLASVTDLQTEIGAGLLNILYPFWELSGVRAEWLTQVRRFDEVWAPTAFVASAFSDTLGRPVRVVRQPLCLPSVAPPPRSGRDTLRLFTFLDFNSYGERKNPIGTVNAFQAAFSRKQQDVELIIKVHGTDSRGLRDWLRRAAAVDRRITIIDGTLDRKQMDEQMAQCDAFVSLHRSEGFGLGAAEALAAGKAVIATNYGGTTDFINSKTGYPIDYKLEPLRPGDYVDTDGQVWATPLQEAAVAALRSIYQDPAEANARAVRGLALLKEQNSPAIIGAQIAGLLRELGAL